MIKVYDTWNKEFWDDEFETVAEVKSAIKQSCLDRASEMADNEIEEDWERYYDTLDEAYEVTVDLIYQQLVDELEIVDTSKNKK